MSADEHLKKLNDDFNRRIDEIHAEYLAWFSRNNETVEGAAYARQSTKDQNSIPDQIREILEEAKRRNICISRANIMFDAGVTGRSSRRKGLDQLEELMKQRRVAVALFFTSSRLFRKIHLMLKFVEEYSKQHGVRIIFVKNNFDSSTPDAEKMLAMHSVIDQFTGTAHIENIRASHIGLFLAGFLVGKLVFGYQGIEVEGQLTRRGFARRKLAILPAEAEVVRIIFRKFLNELPKIRLLVRWLNKTYPPPASSESGKWTKCIVKRILGFTGYTGTFFYGKAESVYISGKNYSLKKLRDQPLAHRHDETLRIIADDEFEKVQRILLKHRRGGRLGRPGKQAIPWLLNGRMYCKVHDKPLHCTGQSGGVMNCAACMELPAEERALYSYLPRQHATERLLEVVIAAIDKAATALIPTIVAECRAYVANVQAIDPARRRKLEADIQRLETAVKNTYNDPGETDEDKALAKQSRDTFRQELAQKRSELADLKKIEALPKQIPSPSDVKRKLKDLKADLACAIKFNRPEELGCASQILDYVLGEKIYLYQRGEAKSHRGWLEGRCEFRLKQYLLAEYGVSDSTASLPDELVIDFRRPRPREIMKQKIFDLYQAGRTIEETAADLKIGDSTVERYLEEIYAELGIPKPSKSERRKLINTRPDKLPFYIRIAPEALRLVQEGFSRAKIVELLDTDRTTLENTMEYLRKQGHEIPDGRSTHSGRKPPESQSPPPQDNGDDETQERQAG